jgi:hypothetical protein
LIIVKNKLFGSRPGYDPDSRKKGKTSFFDELDVFSVGLEGGFTLILSSKE